MWILKSCLARCNLAMKLLFTSALPTVVLKTVFLCIFYHQYLFLFLSQNSFLSVMVSFLVFNTRSHRL